MRVIELELDKERAKDYLAVMTGLAYRPIRFRMCNNIIKVGGREWIKKRYTSPKI